MADNVNLSSNFTAYSFVEQDDLNELHSRVSSTLTSVEDFISSVRLKSCLNDVVQLFLAERIAIYWMKPQNCKCHLDSMIKFTVSLLCVPQISTILGEGKMSEKSASDSSKSSTLAVLSNFVEDIFAFTLSSEHARLEYEEDSCLDEYRAVLILKLIDFHKSQLMPFTHTLSEYMPIALKYMSTHILSVTNLTEIIENKIDQVILEMKILVKTMTSGKSFSDISEELSKCLHALILNYFHRLRENYSELSKLCLTRELLNSIDATLHSQLLEENYQSPKQLVDIYNVRYKHDLKTKGISLPLPSFCIESIERAYKDIRRETLTIDEVSYDSSDATIDGLRGLIKRALLRCRPLPLPLPTTNRSAPPSHSGSPKSVTLKLRERDNSISSSTTTSSSNSSNNTGSDSIFSFLNQLLGTGSPNNDEASAAASTDSTAAPATRVSSTPTGSGSGKSYSSTPSVTPPPVDSDSDIPLIHDHMLEQLLRYTLLACSRTVAAGDALFVTAELYGGHGLVLRPVHLPHCPPKVTLTRSGIKVVMTVEFNLYRKADLETSMDTAQPLIGIHTTITNLLVVGLQEVSSYSRDTTYREIMMVLFKKYLLSPELMCRRTLAIEPFEVPF